MSQDYLIENNYDSTIKRRFSYSSHFSYKHQAAAYANQIPLNNQIKGPAEEEKCLTIQLYGRSNSK